MSSYIRGPCLRIAITNFSYDSIFIAFASFVYVLALCVHGFGAYSKYWFWTQTLTNT